jgi:hypothetical protein
MATELRYIQGTVTLCHENTDKRKDSIEIGTAAKGGCLKVFFDASGSIDETKTLIDNAKAAMDYARELIKKVK